jgi:HAD superfamily phosphatase (TIGR01668 family)
MFSGIPSFVALFKPTYLIEGDITDIDLDSLIADGIKGIIFDLDSTIMAPHSGVITEETAIWIEKARVHFKLSVVSNNKTDSYLQLVENILNMPVHGKAAKPSTKMFLRTLQNFGFEAREVAVIGDRVLTDVLGGRRAGMKTVLVWPLKSMNDSWILFCRKLERLLLHPGCLSSSRLTERQISNFSRERLV